MITLMKSRKKMVKMIKRVNKKPRMTMIIRLKSAMMEKKGGLKTRKQKKLFKMINKILLQTLKLVRMNKLSRRMMKP